MKKYIDFNTEKRENTDFFKKDDQLCLWKNNRKLTKKNQCKISE